MLYIIPGTVFSGHIIMPDHIFTGKSKSLAQPTGQPYQRAIGVLRKFSSFIFVATFNRKGITVSLVGCIGDFRAGNALNNLSVYPDHKMTAHFRFVAVFKVFKIISVFFCRTPWICRIMNYNPVDFFQRDSRSGIFIDVKKFHFKRRRPNKRRILFQPFLLCALLFCSPNTQNKQHNNT